MRGLSSNCGGGELHEGKHADTLRSHVLVMLFGLATIAAQGQALALMGISAGTYLGFEVLGNRSPSCDLSAGKEVLR